MPRFVILRHELPAESERASHWDLMFECDGMLRTWAVESEPIAAIDVVAEALADHRMHYLDYEGPVSGARGTVSQWDRGEYVLERSGDDHWHVLLRGARLMGRMSLCRCEQDHSWRVSFVAAPISG
jgi:hypothetical protein